MQVYFDMMRSFRTEFDDFFKEGFISGVEIGMGASGELMFPSFSERFGWTYPGIGEFQVSGKEYNILICKTDSPFCSISLNLVVLKVWCTRDKFIIILAKICFLCFMLKALHSFDIVQFT